MRAKWGSCKYFSKDFCEGSLRKDLPTASGFYRVKWSRDARAEEARAIDSKLASMPTAVARYAPIALFFSLFALGAPACSGDDEVPADEPVPEVDAGSPDVAAPVDATTPAVDATVEGCTPLTFPTGVTFKTKPDAQLTEAYVSIAQPPNYPLPKCFIDTDDLADPLTGKSYDVDVKVGKYFTLRELVGTSLKYTARVLLSPVLVEKLDRYREALGEPVNVTSGFRSPIHQRAVCQDMCGQDFCPGTCAQRSRHSWGDAVDHGVTPLKKHSDAGCAADFNYVFREGDHVHLDLNPEHPICTVDIL